MFFSITNKYNYNKDLFKAKILKTARYRILLYKTGASELALNEYCINKYKKSLKAVCIALVMATDIKINGSSVIITFKNPECDNLASLITYGDAKLQGSHILHTAFTWN